MPLDTSILKLANNKRIPVNETYFKSETLWEEKGTENMFSRGSKKKSLKTVCSFICVIWVNMHSLHALWLAAVQTISPYKHNCIYSLGYLHIWHAIYLGEHIKRDLRPQTSTKKTKPCLVCAITLQNRALCAFYHFIFLYSSLLIFQWYFKQ